MANSQLRPLVVLNIAKLRRINDFIAKMRGISLNMGNNVALFPAPSPTIATFSTNIDALEAAEAVIKTGLRNAVEARNQAYDLVLDNVHNLQNYVQNLADNAADYDDAVNLIAASGMDIKGRGTRVKPDIEVRNGSISGSVELIVKAKKGRNAYEWQMSADQLTWTMLPVTLQAKTTLTRLTKGQTLYFRSRPVTKGGEGDWSQVVTILVN